jgi:dihydropteroate synthase
VSPSEFKTWLKDPHRRALVMGVLNVTPDSFSDGGRFSDVDAAIAHAHEMAAAGAAVIDIGGESTRPGSLPVPAVEQIRRIVPVIRALAGNIPAVISVDTRQSEVARAALDVGATIVNDISAGGDDATMLPLVARFAAPVILMHMLGQPATMQTDPQYKDVTSEVIDFLRGRIEVAIAAGIGRDSILIDPGIGFGKTASDNLQLLRQLNRFASLGCPLAIGTSRKKFVGRITGESLESRRLFGTAATVAWTVANGAHLVRVHDVGPMSQVVRMIEAIRGVEAAGNPPIP